MSKLGRLLLLAYDALPSGAMYITIEQVNAISRECGVYVGQTILYAQEFGMFVVRPGFVND